MATSANQITSNDGWVLGAAAGADFLLENKSNALVRYCLADAAPAIDTQAYHDLNPGQSAVRVGTGAMYYYTNAISPVTIVVTV